MTYARRCLMAATAMLFLAGPALAQSGAPDATLTLSGGSVAAGIGYSWGQGVLHFRDKDYKFSVQGLSVVDIGVARIDAVGDVYNLPDVQHFPGNFVAAGAGATLAGGGSVAVLENQDGVIIHLHSTTQGLRLNVAASGIHVALEQ